MMKRLLESPEPMTITNVRAGRAIYGDEDHSEIEITLEVEGSHTLMLRLPPRLAHSLNRQVTTAYLAINPPLHQGGGSAMATWQGMEN
jgi:hypothetical protein